MAKRQRISRSEQWWAKAPATVLRCTATLKSDGSRCRREAHSGTNVCATHGALAPAVQVAAATRIQMSVDDAAKMLLRMAQDPEVEVKDKIKILHDLLDRGGLAATSKHLVGVVGDDPIERLFMDLATSPDGLLSGPDQAPYDSKSPPLELQGGDRDGEATDWTDPADEPADVVDAELVADEPDTPAPQPVAPRPLPRRHGPRQARSPATSGAQHDDAARLRAVTPRHLVEALGDLW